MARDSSVMLGEPRATIDSLEEACRRLATCTTWHNKVVDGVHYAGQDDRGDGATGTVTAAAELQTTAAAELQTTAGAVNAASNSALRRAHSTNGVVRGYDSPR